MRLPRMKRWLPSSFLLILPLLPRAITAASPAVNVALKASWNAAPFLLELLETAADENPASYFPLLDRIAAGEFRDLTSDRAVYSGFVNAARANGFLSTPEELSSFDFALSIHSAAPRIEAHYQHYAHNLEPLMGVFYNSSCPAWVQWSHRQKCHVEGDIEEMIDGKESYPNDPRKLPIDRVLETAEGRPAAILYADIEAPEFKGHHERLKKYASEGYVSYRLRYLPPRDRREKPVILSGYGVELVLKKTDYIVMDDRDVKSEVKEAAAAPDQQPLGQLDDTEVQDIKPLQERDLKLLGYKAATFVSRSENRLETLSRLLQDFPKHSAAIADSEVDDEVVKELQSNWEMFIGAGRNIVWINGLQMAESQMNAYGLLRHLRQERKHIEGLQSSGLTSAEAISLLSHNELADAQANEKPPRFDYRDDIEGGGVIIWMNDIEKDARYKDWSPSPIMFLRRVFPGQLHPVRKNVHNLVVPVDFASKNDLRLVAEDFKLYIDRKIAIRFGIVPLFKTEASAKQAKVVYHLFETYGIETALKYISVTLAQEQYAEPSETVFEDVVKATKPKEDSILSFADIFTNEHLNGQISKARGYAKRLGVSGLTPPLFINGQPLPKDDDWTQNMGNQIQMDIAIIQQAAFRGALEEETDISALLLEGVAPSRNVHIFPESEAAVKLVDLSRIAGSDPEIFYQIPKARIIRNEGEKVSDTALWLVGDFDEPDGYELLVNAARLQKELGSVDLVLFNNPQVVPQSPTLSTLLYQLQKLDLLTPELLQKVIEEVKPAKGDGVKQLPKVESLADGVEGFVKPETWAYPDHLEAAKFWARSQKLLKTSGFAPGQRGVIVNGRVVGPIPIEEEFSADDFKGLYAYEYSRRIGPVVEASKQIGFRGKLQDEQYSGSLGFPALISKVALVYHPDVVPGLFEDSDMSRVDVLSKLQIGEKHTAISIGDKDTATIQIVASIDPASEVAQRWVPLLKAVSGMKGVYLKIHLNPPSIVTELPVKRFYRHVLNPSPKFDDDGKLVEPQAHFENLPGQPLLSLSMDVPPPWLVTPKVCIYDLDNLKLDALKERLRGADVEALYELESILIEGHSRDTTVGGVPRGVQLVLGTKREKHYQDTIIMANLGYFQFKANPGIWYIDLQEGASSDIYNIESLGAKGWHSRSQADEDPEVGVTSFQGATLFPRLSRKPGKEKAEVLEQAEAPASTVEKAKKWFGKKVEKATNMLQDYGGSKLAAEEAASAAWRTSTQADINIFSVASGHLYERFLNIMMLSVMKNTDKTIKFWFIENFLSPSFKDFIPIMAKEYGFDYELVTYKWPHWLRSQKEKQREIWGYKILFLDVLFPLDLDKVIFVDADQIVRTDLKELVDLDLDGAPYGFTPMCDSRKEIEGFRFWKQGYWKNFLQGLPYHISALYVVDLKKFRQIAAGDRLRQQYHALSADPASLANLDQDLPNHMQSILPIHSLPQDWLWCETWCSDESLKTAKTIDLCNNPMTKEPKLDRARRQVPEWTKYDNEIADLARRTLKGGHLTDAGRVETKEAQKAKEPKGTKEEKAKETVKDEL